MTQLGKYELHEQLGKGGFGTVYRAVDTTLGKEVAIKLLHPQLMVDDEFIHRFHKEAKALASLDNNNIVAIYELDEKDGRIFIAMRYLPGKSLKDRINVQGKIPLDQAVGILKQVANGLSDAHAKGLVHRDLKPENILFDSHGNAVITDFGLVKAATEGSSFSIDRVIGTPSYIAPEIWQGEKASSASDQYALACILYEMLSGKVLFSGNLLEIIKKHSEILDQVELPDSIPQAVSTVMIKALSKAESERYSDVQSFVIELEKVANQGDRRGPYIDEGGGGGGGEDGGGWSTSIWEKIKSFWQSLQIRTKKTILFGSIGVVFVAIVLVLLFLPGKNVQNPEPVNNIQGNEFYYSSNIEGRENIYFYKNGMTERKTKSDLYDDWDPVLSKDGTLFFTCNRFDNKAEICYMDNKDGSIKRVTNTPGKYESWQPAPLSNGVVYFTTNRNGYDEIMVIDKGVTRRIFNSDTTFSSWDPSPDNNGNLFFTSDRDGGLAEIYWLTPEGVVNQVTHTEGSYQSWDPKRNDTGNLYFSSNRDGYTNIFVLKPNTITPSPVTFSQGNYSSWNPIPQAGNNVCFSSNRGSNVKIYCVNSEGQVKDAAFIPGNVTGRYPDSGKH